MKIAVRYFSMHGNTKAIAEEIADEAGVKAVSISDEPELKERVDLLFLGGAPYWSVMAPELEEYARKIDPALVGTVVLFTTSNWSRRTAIGLRDILEKRGITVAPGHFYAHMTQIQKRKSAARAFAREALNKADNTAHNTGLLPELKTEAITVGTIAAAVIVLMLILARSGGKRA